MKTWKNINSIVDGNFFNDSSLMASTSRRAEELKKIQDMELNRGIFDVRQSFHNQFANCPWIIVRNLSYHLSEGDIVTIFEQYGTITSFELLRDDETGDSRGIAIMAYEDPRSAILAVDNFNAVTILEHQISVDHVEYKPSNKSMMTDPRTKVPARLSSDKQALMRPVFDSESASSTDDEE